MNELDDRERQADEMVEDALNTLPLTPVPPTLYLATMARIRATQPIPHFRLGWMDYALAVLGVVMVSAIFMLWPTIPAEAFRTPEIDVMTTFQGLTPAILVPTLGAALFLIIAAIAALVILDSKPSTHYIIRPH